MRVAAAAYPVEVLPHRDSLAGKLSRWVTGAARSGVRIAVFPEYAGMEAALLGDARASDWCVAAAETSLWYRDMVAALARAHRLTILSGSAPAWSEDGLVNRAWLCVPDCAPVPVDKHVLTPWERAHTPLVPGRGLFTCDCPWGRLGALICYDAEFPTLTRAMAPDILLIPACTDSAAGQARLRIAAQARALEAQCVTVHAPLLGQVPHCPLIDTNTGQAGIYAPPDRDLPDDGVLAQGRRDVPGWTIADAPLALVRARRTDGEVTLRADWVDMPAARSVAVTPAPEAAPGAHAVGP